MGVGVWDRDGGPLELGLELVVVVVVLIFDGAIDEVACFGGGVVLSCGRRVLPIVLLGAVTPWESLGEGMVRTE